MMNVFCPVLLLMHSLSPISQFRHLTNVFFKYSMYISSNCHAGAHHTAKTTAFHQNNICLRNNSYTLLLTSFYKLNLMYICQKFYPDILFLQHVQTCIVCKAWQRRIGLWVQMKMLMIGNNNKVFRMYAFTLLQLSLN